MTLYRRFKEELFPGPCTDREVMRLFTEIEDQYSAPTRFYHDLGHIRNCLNVFDSVNHGAIEQKAICAAIFYHDVIYDAKVKDNEAQSASLAYQRLVEIGCPERFAVKVMNLIVATTHGGGLTDLDEQIIADIDLSELAVDWATFSASTTSIHKEYSHLTDEEFRAGKAAFFGDMLKRSSIYYGRPFQILFEARAHENIQRTLTELGV